MADGIIQKILSWSNSIKIGEQIWVAEVFEHTGNLMRQNARDSLARISFEHNPSKINKMVCTYP